MSPTATTGLLLGGLLGGSVLLLVAALMGWRPPVRRSAPDRSDRSGSVWWNTAARRRAVIGVAVGLLVLIVTRWPVAGIAVAALIYLWPTMFGAGRHATGQLARLEALTVWTESLRDSIAGSVGLEQAIRHSLHTAPPLLQPALQRMDGRMAMQVPLPEALARFAEEFEDSSADLVIAALILNSRLRGQGLVATLTQLATSAREEIEMRRRVEEGRKAIRRAALIVVGATAALAAAVTLLSRDFVAPYSTAGGQVMLAVVLAVFAGGLMWMRSAAAFKPPQRFLAGVEQLERATQPRTTSAAGDL